MNLSPRGKGGEGAERIWRSFAGPVPDFEGLEDLESLAKRFIDLRIHMGLFFHSRGHAILKFVGFLKACGITRPADVTFEHFLGFFEEHLRLRDRTWNNYISTISLWFDHLKAIGRVKQNPSALLKRYPREDFTSYIFSREELRRLVRPEDPNQDRQDRGVIYHFIYACGLRVSEAAKLEMKDVHWKDGTVFIRKSKFSKDRLLPVHPLILGRIDEYLRGRRGGREALAPEERVFMTSSGRRWTGHHISWFFRADLVKLGIYRPNRVVGGLVQGSPRAHALRHSMACHRLLRWYREGADVQAKLPILSTYLGHASWHFSQVYLKTTALLLREADKRFGEAFEKEFRLKP